MRITFYESDFEAVLVPHNDPVVTTATVGDCKISHLLVEEGSASSLLYLNSWSMMKLKDELILKNVGEVAGFNGSTSQPYGKIMLNVTLHNKVVSSDFYLMSYNPPTMGSWEETGHIKWEQYLSTILVFEIS